MRVATLIAGLRSDVRRWGLSGAIQSRVLGLLHDHCGVTFHLLRRRSVDDARETPPAVGALAEIEARRLTVEEINRMANDPALDITPAYAEAAIARGDLCFGALRHGEVVGYTWRTATPRHAHDDVWVVPAAQCCYAYKAYVRPQHRGYGLIGYLVLRCNSVLHERGWKYEVSYITAHNLSSLRTGRTTGAERRGLAMIVRMFGRSYCFHTASIAHAGLGFERRPRSDG